MAVNYGTYYFDGINFSQATALYTDAALTTLAPDGFYFNGIFDGNSHRIDNITIDDGDVGNNYLALFGMIQSHGQINNLSVSASITGSTGVSIGVLGGHNFGIIYNCHTSGS